MGKRLDKVFGPRRDDPQVQAYVVGQTKRHLTPAEATAAEKAAQQLPQEVRRQIDRTTRR